MKQRSNVDMFGYQKPRQKPRKLMHVVDAGSDTFVNMECPHCGYDDGWQQKEENMYQLKRGLPCPKCNGTTS